MSTFSDWNGPGHCGGPNLPQVRTLEQLLVDIHALETRVQALNTELENHKGKQVITPTNPAHTQGTAPWTTASDITAEDNKVKQRYIGGLFTGDDPVKGTMQSQIDKITDNSQATSIGSQIVVHNNRDPATSFSGKLKHMDVWEFMSSIFADTRDSPGIPYNFNTDSLVDQSRQTIRSRIKAAIDDLIQDFLVGNTFISNFNASEISLVRPGATDLADLTSYLRVLKLKTTTLLDIMPSIMIAGDVALKTNILIEPYLVNTPIRFVIERPNDTDTDGSVIKENVAYVLGEINYYGTETDKRPCSFIAFARHTDTSKVAFIVNGTVQKVRADSTVRNGYEGALSATITNVSEVVKDGTRRPRNITVGLYSSTDIAGKSHVYLGCLIEGEGPASGHTGMTTNESGMFFDVSGINIIPMNVIPEQMGNLKATLPQGSLQYIDEVTATLPKSFAARQISTDDIHSQDGHSLVHVTMDEVQIGDKQPRNKAGKDVTMFSAKRLDVYDESGAQHQVAYIEDIGQSIYWQRTVDVFVDRFDYYTSGVPASDLDALNTSDEFKVSVIEEPNGDWTVVQPYTPGSVLKPGFYTADPRGMEPRAYFFDKDHNAEFMGVALLRNNDDVNFIEYKADLFTATPLDASVSNNVPVSTMAGYEVEHIQASMDPNLATTIRGKRSNGTNVYGFVRAIIDDGSTCLVDLFPNAESPEQVEMRHYVPSYAKWDYTNLVWVAGDVISIPDTADGHISDATYQWFGARFQRKGDIADAYFGTSYILWSVVHERAIYGGDAWSFVNLPLEQYRTAAAQDVIDKEIIDFASIQSDYVEMEQYMPNPVGGSGEIVLNPSYIQNKPFTGQSFLDGGGFEESETHWKWLIDGGDLTPLMANFACNEILPVVGTRITISINSIASGTTPIRVDDIIVSNMNQNYAVIVSINVTANTCDVRGVAIAPDQQITQALTAAPEHQFRNVMMRQMGGNKVVDTTEGKIIQPKLDPNFIAVLKWCQNTRQLYIDNGTELVLLNSTKLVDLVRFSNEYIQTAEHEVTTDKDYKVIMNSIQLLDSNMQSTATAGFAPENSALANAFDVTQTSDESPQDDRDIGPEIVGRTIEFNETADEKVVEMASPRLDSLEEEVVYKEAFNDTPVISSIAITASDVNTLKSKVDLVEPWHSIDNTGNIENEIVSDKSVKLGEDTINFAQDADTNNITISSPRLDKLEDRLDKLVVDTVDVSDISVDSVTFKIGLSNPVTEDVVEHEVKLVAAKGYNDKATFTIERVSGTGEIEIGSERMDAIETALNADYVTGVELNVSNVHSNQIDTVVALKNITTGAVSQATSSLTVPALPPAPANDGTYRLTCVIVAGDPTYSWEEVV